MRSVRFWYRFTREAADVPSSVNVPGQVGWGTLAYWKLSLPMTGELHLNDLTGPFQHRLSVVLWFYMIPTDMTHRN